MLIKLAEFMQPSRILSKPHKGVVIANEDPLKIGRVKCAIDNIFIGSEEELPWITPYNTDPSKFDVPEIGQELIIEFPYRDIYSPFFTGFWHNIDNHDAAFDADYPNTFGINKGGLKIIHNKKTKESNLEHPSGLTVKITPDGSLELNITKELLTNITDNLIINGDKGLMAVFNDIVSLSSSADVSISSSANASLKGTGGTEVGTSSSTTIVSGNVVLIGGGGLPVAIMGSTCIGSGNLAAPVVSTIIDGSTKVLAAR